jgi:hypothetical protein
MNTDVGESECNVQNMFAFTLTNISVHTQLLIDLMLVVFAGEGECNMQNMFCMLQRDHSTAQAEARTRTQSCTMCTNSKHSIPSLAHS